MTHKIRVGVFMGGASSEREISLASGRRIAEQLSRDRYEVVMLDTLALMAGNPKLPSELQAAARALVAGRRRRRALPGPEAAPRKSLAQVPEPVLPATEAIAPAGGAAVIDVAFLALHGPYGEDGTMQGMLDLLGIPYVGSGPLASALAMDKVMAKRMFAAAGVPTPHGITLERREFTTDPEGVARRAAEAFLPAVVKPARQGSSIGMSMVREASAMRAALAAAFALDARVLVEERLVGTELTVGILGNRDPVALPVIEIVSKRDFFDYRAKYDPTLSEEICPARVPPDVAAAAQALALRAHQALDCRGVSRVDLIHTPKILAVLEVNTLPGMTQNSLLPKAARAAGIDFPGLLDRLIALALEPEA